MIPVKSRTSVERLLRSVALATLASVFCGMFLWDGYFGYARSNAEQLSKLLGLPTDPRPVILPNLTALRGKALAEQCASYKRPDKLYSELGYPGLIQGNDSYYLGPGGHLKLQIESGVVKNAEWISATHDDQELAWQRGIGYALSLPALLSILHLLRVAVFTVSVNATHLNVSGRHPIPLAAISRIVPAESASDHSATIHYAAGDQHKTLALDSYRAGRWKSIVAAVCEQRNLSDPFAPDSNRTPDPACRE